MYVCRLMKIFMGFNILSVNKTQKLCLNIILLWRCQDRSAQDKLMYCRFVRFRTH